MKRFLVFMVLAVVLAQPARAQEDCGRKLHDFASGYWMIVKGMADYKAAMDAGYAACTVKHPQEFAPLRTANDFMQTNMQAEMDQARAVIDYLIENPDPKKVSHQCVDDALAKKAVKEDVQAFIEGQYTKAYARRYKIMADAGLVGSEHDSCMKVLEMVRQYEEYYDRFDQLQYVLFEASKKQDLPGFSNGRDRKDAFRGFKKTRDALESN